MQSSWQDPPEYRTTPQVALPRWTKVTRRLLIANVAIFLLSFLTFLVAEDAYRAIVRHLALAPEQWRALFPIVPLWQLFTYGFLHSVTDPFHVIGNMLMLYFFGTMLEEMLGSRRFLLTYGAAQLAGALLFLVPAFFTESSARAVGASGAVYGVMIAVATLRPRQTVFLLFIPVTLKILALGILALTIFGALLALKLPGADSTAHLVHLGGIAYGFLAVRSGLIAKDPLEILERRRAIAQVEKQAGDEQRMDELLAKISREGMNSLSRGERDFLRRVSARK
jgi:membrane associated rhomboid family serine protease